MCVCWLSCTSNQPLHLQVWLCMHYILWRIKKLEGLAGATDDDADLLRQNARALLVTESGGCHLSSGHSATSLTCTCTSCSILRALWA
jgi:hypothetical protein